MQQGSPQGRMRSSFEEHICKRHSSSFASVGAMRAMLLRKDPDGNYADERTQWAWEAYTEAHNELASDITRKKASIFRMQVMMGSAAKRLSSSEDCSDVPAKLWREVQESVSLRGDYSLPGVEVTARALYAQWIDLAKAVNQPSFEMLSPTQVEYWCEKARKLHQEIVLNTDEMSANAEILQ